MKRKSIVFDQLLRKILPVDRLPLVDQADIRSALLQNDPHSIEKVALEAIEKLVRMGHLRLIEEQIQGGERVLRYRDLTSANVIALRLPGDTDTGIIRIPLPLRHWRSTASLESIRSMFALYNRILGRETKLLASVPEITRQLIQSGRSILNCDLVTFAPASRSQGREAEMDPSELAEVFDPYLAQEWVVERNYLIYIPELSEADITTRSVPAGMKSLAMVKLGDSVSGICGTLQAWSDRPHFFNEERLGLLSLLSESGTEILGRAAILGNLVFVDAATKVYNRSYFNIQMENEIARARREGQSMSLVIFDIDDFKAFNTKYGYEGGNDVLSRVARLLKSGLRPFDSVARWGGEEFALILTSPISLADGQAVTNRLRRAVEKQLFSVTGLDGKSHSVTLTISGGGALYPDDAVSATDLWRAANAALMWSKQHGKNQVTFFPELAGGEPHPEEEP